MGDIKRMTVNKQSHLLSPPICCDTCASPNIKFVKNDAVYGKIYGKWPFMYHCTDCGASVGCHPNTNIPLGRMGDGETRRLRHKCHHYFDQLWRDGFMSRTYAYKWLAHTLSIAEDDCHISWLSKEQLEAAITAVQDYLTQNERIAERRIERRAKRRHKQHEREQRNLQRFAKTVSRTGRRSSRETDVE